MANETVTYSLEAVLTRIEGKIDSLQRHVNQKFDKIDERLTKVEIGQSEIRGDIKALDERLTTEIKGLTTRVAYQEFTNRGIFIALVVAILGGAAKLFGFFPNP
jgi:peptidoglycan hydrolase CwlO-like protein